MIFSGRSIGYKPGLCRSRQVCFCRSVPVFASLLPVFTGLWLFVTFSTGLRRSLPVSTGLYRSLLASTGLYLFSTFSAGLCWSPPGSAVLYRSLSIFAVFAGICWSLSVSTSRTAGFCRSLPVFTGLWPSLSLRFSPVSGRTACILVPGRLISAVVRMRSIIAHIIWHQPSTTPDGARPDDAITAANSICVIVAC